MLTEITSLDESNNKCRGSAPSIDCVGAGSSRFATASCTDNQRCMQVPESAPGALRDDLEAGPQLGALGATLPPAEGLISIQSTINVPPKEVNDP